MPVRRIVAINLGMACLVCMPATSMAEPPANPARVHQVAQRETSLHEVRTLKGPAAVVSAVRFGESAETLAAGYFNNQIHVWNAEKPDGLSLQGHENWVTAVAWSPKGALLASAGMDKKILLWEPPGEKPVKTLPGHDQWIRALAISGDGRLLASAGDDNLVKVWNIESGALRFPLEGHGDWVMALAFSPQGDLLASGGLDGTIRLWHAVDGRASLAIQAENQRVLALAFDPYGRVIASGGADRLPTLPSPNLGEGRVGGRVRLWDAHTGRLIHTLEGHTDDVRAVAFHPGGRLLASASQDRTVRLWDTLTGQTLQVLTGHNQWVLAVDFSADGEQLASAGADETVRIWGWDQ